MINLDWKVEVDKYQYLDDFIVGYYSAIKVIHITQPYISFGLICAGIEFLGKCLDEYHEFSDYNRGFTKRQFNMLYHNYFLNI